MEKKMKEFPGKSRLLMKIPARQRENISIISSRFIWIPHLSWTELQSDGKATSTSRSSTESVDLDSTRNPPGYLNFNLSFLAEQ